ncbi:MAG TPA: ABC transporter ATP-binding protein [Tepidisphaeraceae bacterium]|jgi:ABC-type polysaccharide/polyol phosphate transport system ATPase subunit|nr:ABC transporter ATP-binding protein [Tepidisphaeraceae bacterium]
MSKPAVISADRLGKTFRLYRKPSGRLVEWLTLGRAVRHTDFDALRDISFQVGRGESLGIIGVNGSGKSTLLKILSSALHPTAGAYHVEGRLLSLLELGTGLNMELTGRANVINSARLLGFPDEYPREKMGDIEAFAELGDFFDRPVRVYSSGMLVRLVFSIFACFDPDVFIVDEALSVGDVYFQQKCARRLREMVAAGVTMLFVSHDLGAVEALCDRVMVLHKGTMHFLGDKRRGIAVYYSLLGASMPAPVVMPTRPAKPALIPDADAGADDIPWQAPDTFDATGDGRVRITGIAFRTADGTTVPTVPRGQWIDVLVRYEAAEDVGPINASINLYDRMNQMLFAVNWLNAEMDPIWLDKHQQAIGRFSVKLDLEPGQYILWLGATQALPDPQSPTGWNQNIGGERLAALPRAGKLAVLPPADGLRRSFGPANLQYVLRRTVYPSPGAESAAPPSVRSAS